MSDRKNKYTINIIDRTMEINTFVKNFAEQFEETDAAIFTPETKFREIEEWCSLTVMAIIGMADEVYHVRLTGDEMKASSTIEDVYNCVKSKV